MPRLTPEQAAAVDRTATKWEKPAIEAVAAHSDGEALGAMHCRVLDLLDQLRDTTARAEQAEKDAALLAEIIRIAMGDAPALIQLSQSQQAAFNRALASGALQRAKGGA